MSFVVPPSATAVVEAVKYFGSLASGKNSCCCRFQLLLCGRGGGDGVVSPTVRWHKCKTTVPTLASACLLQVPFNMSTSGMVFPCDELQNRCGTDGHGLKLCTLYLPVAGAPRGAT